MEWLVSKGSFHKAVCCFCVMITFVLKAGYRSILLPDVGVGSLSGSLSGFVGVILLTWLPVRAWYALVSAALNTVNGPDCCRSHFDALT